MNESSDSLGAGAESTIDTTGPHVSARIIRGTLLVGSVTLLVKGVGFVKEVWVASTYGRGDALEAFLIALVLPSIVAGIVGGAFSQTFLPIYMRVRRKRGAAAADRLFRHSLALGTVFLLGAAAALWLGAPWVLRLLAAGYEPEKFELAVTTLRRLSPVCVLAGLPLMISILLHARERFGLVSLAQGAVPALTLGLLLWWGGDAGILPLVVGVLAGMVLETVALVVAARRLGHQVFGQIGTVESRVDGDGGDGQASSDSAEVLGQWLPAAGGMVFQQITTLVDQAMAAYLVAGSVAALSYAYKLIALPLGLATLSVGTAILPVLSELAGETRWSEFWQSTRRWLRISLWGSLVPTLLLFALAKPLVAMVYQRGSFGGADTEVVATVLAAYAGMIPFYVVGIVGVRVMSVLGLNRLLLTLGAVNLVTNVVGNVVLSRLYGAAGIALATVVVYLISSLLILGRLWRARRELAVTDSG